jgi:hypothetical protein
MHLIYCESTGKTHIQRELAWEGKNLPKPALCGYQPRASEVDGDDRNSIEARLLCSCRRCGDLSRYL